jgi:hypothetical protein
MDVVTILGIGPNKVCALPLAAGRNKGGHYFKYFSSYLILLLLFKIPEEVIVGF